MATDANQPTVPQVTMTLSAIAATAATPRPSGETLAEQSARIILGINQQLADISLATEGTWVLSWLGVSPGNANMAYLARNTDGSNSFAVVIRGTVGSVTDLLEDLDVGTVVPFNLVGMPSSVSVSKGAMKAFTQVVTMSTAGVTLAQALNTALSQAEPNPTVYVTGHSLGGCIATMVAPYLQTLTWPKGKPNFELHTFAAPTAGGADFAAYVDSLDWQANERHFNINDMVPQAWNNLEVTKQWYLTPGPAADDDVKAVISALVALPGPNVYVQPGKDDPLNDSYDPVDPNLVKASLQDFMGQVAFQHANSTYLGLLGAPDVQSGPVVTVVTPVGTTGAPVEIVGSGFGEGVMVDFGTVPISKEYVLRDDVIVVWAPEGVGVVDIRATNNLGTSPAVPRGQFSYGGPAAVVATGISPDTGRAGDQVQINGVNFASDCQVYFGDNLAELVDYAPEQLLVNAPKPTIGVGKSATVNVTVLSNGYSSPATPADEFTYLEWHRP
ncbi:lipase family protein [Streptomyces sp. NBC_00555]|uniref:lipase family protein n=1 Tax=Streptomyces sp. NBC_00555 TaxID=2903662 RepID=UPI00224F6468|nr:lipase family protein [Streptomyces sp. NBC_00555]MCX5009712.1 lipase family protein [Streptomyces sp. NBC_00555]